MHIHLHDARTLRITNIGSAYDTLAALPGAQYDKATKSLLVPLCHLRRISQMRPVVIDHECVMARLDLWRRWVQQHNAAGVWFSLADDGETVVPTGEGVSPAFVEHVASLSNVLERFLGDQVLVDADAPTPVRAVEPTHGVRLIWDGIVNAGKAAERKAEVVERAKSKRRAAKRRQARQMNLLEE